MDTLRPIAALALLLALALAAAGCGEEPSPRAQVPAGGSPEDAHAPEVPQPVEHELDAEWWARRPQLRLVLTGGQQGVFEPCGCTTPRLGGLERMAAVLHQLQRRADEGPGVLAALSAGWSLRGRGEEQEEAKAAYIRAVHEALGFSATLLGEGDLRVAAMSQARGGGVEIPRPPLNVRLAAVNPAFDSTPFADFNVGPLKVRAFGILDPRRAEVLEAQGQVQAVVSVSRALEALQPKPDTLWIVASRFEDAAAAEVVRAGLARLGPGVVVDVSDGGAGAARTLDRVPLKAGGEPLLVEVGDLGKAVGVLDLEPDAQIQGWRASYRRIELVPQWEKYGGAPLQRVRTLEAEYRRLVRERGYLEAHPREPASPVRFVGSSACARCHAAIYNEWRRSPHAAALETLEREGYAWDAECVRCHVVGWSRAAQEGDDWRLAASGFVSPARTPYLGGVGCESCHGPGSAHAADPRRTDLFAAGGPNVARPDAGLCRACHDAENSHGFDAGYEQHLLPAVDHRRVPADIKSVLPPDWEPPGR